jgi:hypothetical protein
MTAPLRTDLNDFLFAPVASDASGPLTMLSVLARTGVDPWAEAADLAALSRDSAAGRLILLLAELPNGPAPGEPTAKLASHLVALLHPSTRRPAATAAVAEPAAVMHPTSASNPRAIYYLLAMIVMLGALWAQSSRSAPAATNTSLPGLP